MIYRKIATLAITLFVFTVARPQLGQAYEFSDSAAGFNTGTYTNTKLNGSNNVEIDVKTTLTGNYTSAIKDAGTSQVWNTFSWIPYQAYSKALPNNGVTETGYGNPMNMSGIQGLWHLDEAAGSTTFVDTSGGVIHDGTCPTVPFSPTTSTATIECPTVGVSGKFKGGVQFSQLPGNINTMIQTTLDVNPATMPSTTWSAWMNVTGTSSRQSIMTNDNGSFDRGLTIEKRSGKYYLGVFAGKYSNTIGTAWVPNTAAVPNTEVQPNTWYHVAASYTGDQVTIYLNGKKFYDAAVDTDATVGQQVSNKNLAIGNNPSYPASGQFYGSIDEAVVFNRVLSDSEIQNLYQRGVLKLTLQARSCDDSTCTGEAFVGPDGTSSSSYSDANNPSTTTPLFVPTLNHNRYVQYKATFENTNAADTTITPQLTSVKMTAATPTVDWSQCGVQQGTTTIVAGDSVKEVAISTPIENITKAFVLVNSTGTYNARQPASHFVSGYISDVDTIKFERGGTVDQAEVSYAVVECKLNEFTVQRGEIVLSGTSNQTSLPTPVDYSRSMVLMSSRTTDTSVTEKNALVTGVLSSDGRVVTVQRVGNAGTTPVRYEVITFTPESEVKILTNELTLSSGQSASTHTAAADLSSLGLSDPSRAWLYCSYDTSNDAVAASTVGCDVSDDGKWADFSRYSTYSYTNRIRYYAIAFPPNTVKVQSGKTAVHNPTDPDYQYSKHDIPITSVVTINKAFAFVTNTTAGTGTYFPRDRWLVHLADPTTLRTVTYTSDEFSAASDSNYKYWQVIQFPLFSQPLGYGWIGNAADACGTTGSSTCGGTSFISYNATVPDTDGKAATVQLETGTGCNDHCNVTGFAWAGNYNQTAASPNYTLGWIDFDPANATAIPPNVSSDPAEWKQEAHWNEHTGELYGWARWTGLAKYENDIYSASKKNDWGWIKLRGNVSGSNGITYGVRYDTSLRQLVGWAWNDNGSDTAGTKMAGSGLGWIDFDADTTDLDTAWLQTLEGDVYAKEGFDTNPAPAGQYNATYLIQADGTITNFNSEYAAQYPDTFAADSNYTAINAPVDNTRDVYRGNIGTIHVSELVEQAKQQGTAYTDCDDLMIALSLLSNSSPLGGKVYYCPGPSLTVTPSLTFVNQQQNTLGAGTIVVDGDITIQADTKYQDTAINNVNNIATVAWIATGDITIGSNVTQTVGAYVALGDTFKTEGSNVQLQLSGLTLAKRFIFDRAIVGTDSASKSAEKIIYDTRLVTNPPPGLEDLTKGLPKIQ